MSNGFRMTVVDMFAIGGDEALAMNGLVLTGLVEEGVVTVGDSVDVIAANGDKRAAVLNGVEIYGKDTDTASKGNNVGLLFTELKKKDVSRGDVLQS